jgi:murein DD-endopeptidase MepM/ murein hydrolase activator NlpD
MLGIGGDALRAALNGDRLGFRARIKPSWSGRVYGTYCLNGRLFLFAAVFVVASLALLGRLLALNLAEPSTATEAAALRRAAAHAAAWREVRRPALARAIERDTEELYSRAHQLDTVLGLGDLGRGDAGLGRSEELLTGLQAPPPAVTLDKLAGDVSRLEARFDRLSSELTERRAEWDYLPSIVPIFAAQFVPTSPFGRRVSPFTRLPEIHRGQDLAADMYTKIVATADGVVVTAERDASRSRMGRYLVIDHDGRYQTYYGHCERLFVEVGEQIKRHQIIAEVGSTGRSTGPHVHYEIRIAGEPRDPRHFLVLDPHFSSEEQLRFE